jgi:phosphoribosylanthranilate isomerase
MDASLLRTRRTRVKFCGMTSAADIGLAVAAGADAVGVIVARSERQVTLEQAATIARAIPPFVSAVAVLGDDIGDADALRALGFTLQFSAPTPPADCERASAGRPYIKAFHVTPDGQIDVGAPELDLFAYENAVWLFDAASPGRYGGSGIAFRWEALGELAERRPLVIAGGLTAENVGTVVRTLRPFAVDARSGVERDGAKDAERMQAFVRAVVAADAEAAR